MQVHNPNGMPTIPIKDLLPTQGELKDLTEANYNKLKANIERRGFIDPVSVWEDEKGLKHLLNGHQRRRVLMSEGWNEPIPYFNIPAENIQEAAAIVLELTSQYGTVTQEGLDQMIATYELPEAQVYEATHFDALPVYDTAEEEPEIEEDEAPEVDESEPPKSKLGEIYQLGRHRVMCGDSTDKANVTDLLNGENNFAIVTDPPYGIGIDGQKESKSKNPKHNRKAHEFKGWDNKRPTKKQFDLMLEFSVPTVIFGGNYFADLLPPTRGWIYWDKGQNGLTMSDGELAWTSLNTPLRAIKSNRANIGDSQHPTQKPIEVMSFACDYSGKDTVVDVFLGSGSTLIACEQTDRTCFGMELDPKYVDVIRKRYAKFTSPDNELPENWEELTPAINTGKKQA